MFGSEPAPVAGAAPTTGSRFSRALNRFVTRWPARAAVLVFVIAALVFAGLLSLPIATADGTPTAFHDALFTAVSAVTVTGLTTVNTAEHWSLFGEIVILFAVQTGGLGVVTLALLLARIVTRRLGVGGKVFAQEVIGASGLGDVWRLLRVVLLTTFTIEAALMVVLVPAFTATEGSFGLGLWHGLFYAVSAFGNAGFTLHAEGLATFDGNFAILIPIMVGVFVGSLGFPVFLNLIRARWVRKQWTLHTKLTLATTLILFALGAAGWCVAEWNNPATIGERSVPDSIFHGLFASVMMRSGGFSIVDPAMSSPTAWLFTDALMFVGGGSASTAGGIKVTTLAVLFLAIVAEARGTKHVNVAGRRIPVSTQRLAISVTFLGATLVLVSTSMIMLTNPVGLDRALFEVISAFATCGLSIGLSEELNPFGKYVLSVLMLMGRVGPIALATALAVRQRNVLFTLPEERPVIG
ncbi:TrkH family potassium uptake protein [Pseudoclavibacter terrae]|uniref:TrkH family potassium uptake protein n=1 Tax=Pseudoclavibacter terrae TaxID=1530195 RepID=A0A7J5AXJ7_9MICO|nr:potassium transporter TrkG [Pseudoclavibacter terrae]KAB1636194.1 TrkH family potassium uptake protein [Pseudoclavibacter terrae]